MAGSEGQACPICYDWLVSGINASIMPNDSLIFYKGDWGEWEKPTNPLLNRAFKYGDGLFETLRIRHGRPLFVEHHLARLQNGLQVLGLDVGENGLHSFYEKEILPLVDAFEGLEGRLRMQAFRLGGGGFLPEEESAGWMVEMVHLNGDPYLDFEPIRLCNYLEIPLQYTAFSALKGVNSLNYILAAKFAGEMNYDDALIYGEGGIAEISNANIFLLREGKLITPELASGCLPGVCRRVVMDIAPGLGLEVEETQVTWEAFLDAEEVFVTNVIRGIRPVGEVEGLNFRVGAGTVGWRIHEALDRGTRAF